MRLIAVHLPERYVDDLEALVEKNLYPNRSEVIRIAIRDMLKRELWDHGRMPTKRSSEVIAE